MLIESFEKSEKNQVDQFKASVITITNSVNELYEKYKFIADKITVANDKLTVTQDRILDTIKKDKEGLLNLIESYSIAYNKSVKINRLLIILILVIVIANIAISLNWIPGIFTTIAK